MVERVDGVEVSAEQVAGFVRHEVGAHVGEPPRRHVGELDERLEVDQARGVRLPAHAGRGKAREPRRVAEYAGRTFEPGQSADVGHVQAKQTGARFERQQLESEGAGDRLAVHLEGQDQALAPLARGELGEGLGSAGQREPRDRAVRPGDDAADEREAGSHRIVGGVEREPQLEGLAVGRQRHSRAAALGSCREPLLGGERHEPVPARHVDAPLVELDTGAADDHDVARRRGAVQPEASALAGRVGWRPVAGRPAARPVHDDAAAAAPGGRLPDELGRDGAGVEALRAATRQVAAAVRVEVGHPVRAGEGAGGDGRPVGRGERGQGGQRPGETPLRQESPADREQSRFGEPPPAARHGGVDADEQDSCRAGHSAASRRPVAGR